MIWSKTKRSIDSDSLTDNGWHESDSNGDQGSCPLCLRKTQTGLFVTRFGIGSEIKKYAFILYFAQFVLSLLLN